MKPELQTALARKLTAMADDELILGQRDSEWCGHAPILEEDIAFANIALDEVGHAGLWYGLLADLLREDRDTYPDTLVYRRGAGDYLNCRLVELPAGDWAFTILRQYFFDSYELQLLGALTGSAYPPLAEVAVKIRKEEIYHHRHTGAWLRRLGLGTTESNRRMQDALEGLWPDASQLFQPGEGESSLVEHNFLPDIGKVESAWLAEVQEKLAAAGLVIPAGWKTTPPDRTVHTRYHEPMILEMQSVVRQHPDAVW